MAYFYYTIIPKNIELEIKQSLNSLGFKKVTFNSIERSSGNIKINDISLDSKSFSGIENLTIEYTLWNYLWNNKRADTIIIKNLKLFGSINDDANLTLEGWKNNNNFLNTISKIPATRIVFQNSNLELLTPEIGGIKLLYEGETEIDHSGEIKITGFARTLQKKMHGNARVNGTITKQGILDINLASDDFKIETKKLSVKRANFQANITAFSDSPIKLSLDASAGSLLWQNLPLRDTNITFEKNNTSLQFYAEGKTPGKAVNEFTAQLSKINNQWALEANIYPEKILDLINYLKNSNFLPKSSNFPKPLLSIEKPIISIEGKSNAPLALAGIFKLSTSKNDFEITGNYIYNNKKISGDFYLPRSFIKLSEKTKTIERKNQKINNTYNDTITVSGNGDFLFSSNNNLPELTWQMSNKIEKSNLNLYGLNFYDIHGNLNIKTSETSNNKLNNAVLYKISLCATCTNSGEAYIDLLSPNSPIIKSAKLNLFDGTIEAESFDKDSIFPPQNFIFKISDIDLNSFASTLGFELIYMSGKAGGNIPLSIIGNKFDINEGLIQSQQSGLIQIPETYTYPIFPGNSNEMIKIRKALKKFRYEFFEIRIDGQIKSIVTLNIIAKGNIIDENNIETPTDLNFRITLKPSDLFKNILSNHN